MSRKTTPRGKGRPWVALHTTLLLDADLILAGNAARLLFPTLLLLSADQGLDGRVPSDPRKVQLAAHLDGGVPEVSDALLDLVRIGKLVEDPAGDPDYLYVRTWDKYQADFGGSTTRSATMSRKKFEQAHAAGKHADGPREGCPACAAGTPAPVVDAVVWHADTVPAPAADAPVADTLPLDVPAAPAADAPITSTKQLLAEFTGCFEDLFAAVGTRLDGYRELLSMADRLGTEYAHLSRPVRGTLMNAVLANALEHYLEGVITGPDYARTYRAAKALSDRDGHWFWILAAQARAGVQYEDAKHAVNDLTKVAANKRSEWLGGAA